MSLLILHIIVSFFFSTPESKEFVLLPAKDGENIAVIVHESVVTGPLSVEQLVNIYTLKTNRWENKDRIRIADYKGSRDIRSQFYKALNTTSNNIRRIWLREQFTGRATPPTTVNSTEEMINLIIENPGTIGYVPASEVPPNIKVIFIIDG